MYASNVGAARVAFITVQKGDWGPGNGETRGQGGLGLLFKVPPLPGGCKKDGKRTGWG